MNFKGRIITIISVSILFIGIAVLVWANQTGRITIWGSETATEIPIKSTVAIDSGVDIGTAQVSGDVSLSTNARQRFIDGTLTWDANYDPLTWEVVSSDSKLTFSGSNSASGSFAWKDHHATAKFNATFNTNGLAINTYLAVINVTIKYQGQVNSTFPIPARIFIKNPRDGSIIGPTPDVAKQYTLIRWGSVGGVANDLIGRAATFWNDGTVTKTSAAKSNDNIVTCFNKPEELNTLYSILDQADFWNMQSLYYGYVLDGYDSSLYARKDTQEHAVTCIASCNLPANVSTLMGQIYNWPDDKKSRDYKSCNLSNGDTEPPTAPTNLTAKYDYIGGGDLTSVEKKIILNWNASTDNIGIYGYKIYNASTNQLIGDTGGHTPIGTNWNMPGLCNTAYSFYIKAYDGKGNISTVSNTANITLPPCSGNDTESPTKPTGLTGSANDYQSITLGWKVSTDNVGPITYDIYDGTTNKLIISTSDLGWRFSGLTENTEYKYYIKAHDTAGNQSPASDTITVKTPSKNGNGGNGNNNGGGTSGSGSTSTSGTNISKLVSTGQALWFNILIALVLSGIVLYFGLNRKKE